MISQIVNTFRSISTTFLVKFVPGNPLILKKSQPTYSILQRQLQQVKLEEEKSLWKFETRMKNHLNQLATFEWNFVQIIKTGAAGYFAI